jgi:ribosomal protein S18 acetylase RimI-like enzyme
MAKPNETTLREYRFLSDAYFPKLYGTFVEAFSDYVFPFVLREDQFRNHIELNGVDLTRSAACLENEDVIGFSLNGFGTWAGKRTVYDAGTGVIPRFRRQGISNRMFDMMLPVLEAEGIEQFLLEVVTTNEAAIRLYEKFGFKPVRELALMQCDQTVPVTDEERSRIQIRSMDEPDWKIFLRFWEGEPSWQNSCDAIDRSSDRKTILAAYVGGECVGYVIFSSIFGRIAQIAVSRDFSGLGVGRRLVREVQDGMAPGYALQVINADKSIARVNEFFKELGFYERLAQYEMIKAI